jgi:hypothetical protein
MAHLSLHLFQNYFWKCDKVTDGFDRQEWPLIDPDQMLNLHVVVLQTEMHPLRIQIVL